MQKVSVTLSDEDIAMLEDEDADNRSESLREALDELRDLRERVDELEDELEHQEARADDLRRQLREANRRDEDVREIVEYVEQERSAEQRWREAGIVTRTKWRLFGMDVDEDE